MAPEIPIIIPPVLTPDGQLTPYFKKAVAYMRQTLTDLEAKGEQWLKAMPEWKLAFFTQVIRGAWTVEMFLTALPAVKQELWQAYFDSLDELEQAKIKAELLALYQQQNSEENMTDQPKEAAMPRLAYGNRLTEAGEKLAELLKRVVPDDVYGKSYLAFVHQKKMYTPARFFSECAPAAARLWKFYEAYSPELAVQEAQKHLDAAEKLIGGLKKSQKPAPATQQQKQPDVTPTANTANADDLPRYREIRAGVLERITQLQESLDDLE